MSQPPLPSTSSSSSSQKGAAPVARTRPDSTMPGLSSTASSIRAKAKGSRLSQPGWTPQDDDDDDGFDEGPGDTQRQLDELKTGILMPGMGARSMTAPTLQQSTSASQRVPIALKSALKKPAPLLRRATGAASTTSSATPSSAAQQSRTAAQPAPSNRFKGTPPRAIRYSLPVRTEKPVRTTKVSGKHVVLPSESQLAPLPGDEEEESSDDDEDDDDESSSEEVAEADDEEPGGVDEEEAQRKRQAQADERKMRRDSVKMARQVESMEKVNREARKAGVVQRGPAHARAPPRVPKTSGPAYHTFERMAPNARTHTALPRLTSYAVGTDLHIPTLNGFLRREHGVRPRLYDECAYVAYFKPLLPGFGRANLRSSPEPRSGSPGAESRRERELEEREERGYMGSYFAASKDDQEESIDPEGYIQGGEGSGSGEGSGGREQKQRQRYRDGDTTEVETETEGEGEVKARDASYELASSPESKEEIRYGTFSDSEEVNVNAADVGDALATPRALKPRNFDLEGVPVGLDALGEPVSSPMSESSGQLTPAGGEGADGTTLSADAAGAQDMLKHQLEDEATERGLTLGEAERGEVSGDVVDDAIVMERDGANGANGEQQDQLAGGRRRRGGGRRKGRKSSGPNQASHNHDTSPNMLTSRPILEALQVAELVVLPYGVVVFYNFSASEERDIIEDILSSGSVRTPHTPDDVETEAFHFCYDPTVPAPRIFNDFFTFRAPNHLLKLSLAHAVAQSTKLSVFEESMQRTLELTSHIPKELASSGELRLKRREALRLTGRLFKLRVDVNLTSNVLDTPELFWSEATLQALYDAIREYLEIDQRVGNLNDRLKVANDLLEIIHGHVAEEAMSKITVVIIALIVVACFVAVGEITARLLRSSNGGEGRALLRLAANKAAAMGIESSRAGQQYHVGL